MKNIIIFGAPGSGKGTYSDEIVSKYGMGHISTGDVLRGEIKNGTELGKIAKGYIDNGQLIPDELMIDILAKTYDAQTPGKGVIFDGFPRTIAQAEALKKMLAERNTDMGMMIELVVDEETLMARLLRQSRSVSKCTEIRLLHFLTGSRRKDSATHSLGRVQRNRCLKTSSMLSMLKTNKASELIENQKV